MKVEITRCEKQRGWTVRANGDETVGIIFPINTEGKLSFYPYLNLDNNFAPKHVGEIRKAVADFITIQRVTRRLTK